MDSYSSNQIKYNVERHFVIDVKDGDEIYYYGDYPEIMASITPYKLGKREGTHYTYFSNGIVSLKITYKDNRRHGELENYKLIGDDGSMMVILPSSQLDPLGR